MKVEAMKNILILLLFVYGCSNPILDTESVEPIGSGFETLMLNPVGVQVYFDLADGSLPLDSIIDIELYDMSDSLLDSDSRILSSIDTHNHGYLFGYIYNVRELDTVYFKLVPSVNHPDLTLKLIVRAYSNVSDTLEFNGESCFRAIVPLIDRSNKPNVIEAKK